jgi:serine phosphatase RsbU (regulator of sigma subunit)
VQSDEHLLAEKARLLLQRERELFELRQRLEQLAVWMGIGRSLPDLFLSRGVPQSEVWDRARKTIVAKLRVQRIVVLEVHADVLRALTPAGPERPLSRDAQSFLATRPWGFCNDPKAEPAGIGVASLAETLGLHQFVWSRIAPTDGPPILMAGGFDHAKAGFRSPFADHDAAHFNNGAQQIASLLGNATLVAELEKEKNRLHQANATLEQRDRALQQATKELLIANETLDLRVRERTQELADRNRELRELPQRIQTSILPRATAAPAITIAARMETAEEVGGDYYDVLPVADGAWIAIGDVAGHGLPAGLITFMLQSAVAALTAAHPDAKPSTVVSLLNAVMYKNIRERLGSDDHITFVLLRVFDDGLVAFAGCHECLLVRRARTGDCETVATRGLWLAATEDIRRATIDAELRLERGDLLVLYTDGVVELRNEAREMFGLERLRVEIAASGGASADEVCQRVFGQLHAWSARPADDVSLVAIRFEGGSKISR